MSPIEIASVESKLIINLCRHVIPKAIISHQSPHPCRATLDSSLLRNTRYSFNFKEIKIALDILIYSLRWVPLIRTTPCCIRTVVKKNLVEIWFVDMKKALVNHQILEWVFPTIIIRTRHDVNRYIYNTPVNWPQWQYVLSFILKIKKFQRFYLVEQIVLQFGRQHFDFHQYHEMAFQYGNI